ncbi:MAG: nucleoside triphosphate pyrophosphohydrolase [Chitinophagales bacterium]
MTDEQLGTMPSGVGRLTVVGLGPGGIEHLTVGVLRRLGLAGRLFTRTQRHPVVRDLEAMGFSFETFDDLYESAPDYTTLYDAIAERLLAATGARGEEAVPLRTRPAGEMPSRVEREVLYAVPGHPSIAERSVARVLELCREAGVPCEVVPGLSWLDAAFAELGLDPTGRADLTVVDALSDASFSPERSYLISHVFNALTAGTLKIRLMEAFPDDHPVTVFQGAGVPEAHRAEVSLFELDRLPWLDHLCSVYVPAATGVVPASEQPDAPPAAQQPDAPPAFPLDQLVGIMARLRGENGCPWDREQTHESLKPYVIEEAYEVWDAIDEGDPEKLCEELGDLLLQVVFHAQLAAERGEFDMNDVAEVISAKLIRRHPHVFGEVEVEGVSDVLRNWEAIKRGERGAKDRKSVLDGVPKHLPALLTAQKMQGKAARAGFEWPSLAQAVEKVWEEAREVKAAYERYEQVAGPAAPPADEATAAPESPDESPAAREAAAARSLVEEELGDLLFAVVNVSRFLRVNAEVALRRTIVKFTRRFHQLEEAARAAGRSLSDYDLAELLALWEQAKTS